MSLILLTHAEQVAAHLRREMSRGRWHHVLPGIQRLSMELGVNHNTVEAALRLLEEEGMVASQGHGLPRRVCASALTGEKRSLRVNILLYGADNRFLPDRIELLARLQEAGHAADFAPTTLQELGMRVERVVRFVKKNPADAWVVCSASQEILKWFSTCPVPAIAMYGRFTGLPIAAASPRKIPAMVTAVRKLVALGHRRIVMLSREERRKPEPALFERAYLDELALLGVPTGPYNLPDWKETPDGLRDCFETLFRHTPPTALILGETTFFMALQQYLSRRGILVPDRLSVICLDPEPAFAWCNPYIAHIDWDFRPLVQRILRWADHIAHGREDRAQTLLLAHLIEGGTIGPVA
jgi:DNA-binding LacI/PurR family transcriptional regulator